MGDLRDPGGLRAAAARADGAIHMALVHDFSDGPAAVAVDRAAATADVEAFQGTGRPVVATTPRGRSATQAPRR